MTTSSRTTSKQIRISRVDGTTSVVNVADGKYFRVDVDGSDNGDLADGDAIYTRHELVLADTPVHALAAVRLTLEKTHSESTSTISEESAEFAAVWHLNGGQILHAVTTPETN